MKINVQMKTFLMHVKPKLLNVKYTLKSMMKR